MSLPFWIGFAIAIATGLALAIGLIGWIRFERWLIELSHPHHRKPVYVRGRSIYLVPEDEYVRDTQLIRRMGAYLDDPRRWTHGRKD